MKKLLFVLPVVLLLAAACNSNKPVAENNQLSNTQPSQNQQAIPPTTTNSVPAGWTTYKNSQSSFSFNYPSGWYLANIKNNADEVTLRSSPGSAGSGQGLLSQAEIGVEISKAASNNTQEVKTWCENNISKFQYATLTVGFSNGRTMTIDGNSACSVDYQIKEDVRLNGRQICVAKGSNKYILVAYPLNSNQISDFDKIVASFKFNDSTAQTTTTKTYTNKDYGFSVEYPTDFILKTDTAVPAEMPNYLGRFGVDVVRFSLSSASIQKGSGVMSADALISVADNPASGTYFFSAVDKSQGVPPPEIRSLPLEKTVTVNGVKYGRAVWGGAAAGTQNFIRVYHVFRNNMWYEVQLNVWASSSGTFSQAATDPTWQKLESILAGFQVTK